MLRRRLLAGLMSLALVPLVAVGTAAPAAAATCATAGHTYVIANGALYTSGFEGNYQNGIQYLVLPEGTSFDVGGNGIKPGTYLDVHLFHTDLVPPDWTLIAQQNAFRQPAGATAWSTRSW